MSLETMCSHVPQLWNLVPTEIKDASSLSIFKEKIKSWHCNNYQCINFLFIFRDKVIMNCKKS